MDHSLELCLIQIGIWKWIVMGMTKGYFVERMDYSTSKQEPSTLIWSSDFVNDQNIEWACSFMKLSGSFEDFPET